MRSLSSYARRNLLRRPARYALTSIGVALGVGILFGVLVATTATSRALDRIASGVVGRGRGDRVALAAVGTYDSTMPADTAARVTSLPGVRAAAEWLEFRSSVRRDTGAPAAAVSEGEMLTLAGTDFASTAAVLGVRVTHGALPQPGADEVAVPASLARSLRVAVDEHLALTTSTGPRSPRVSAILDDDGIGSVDSGRAVFTSLPTAQTWVGRGAVLTSLDVALTPGTPRASWIRANRPVIGDGVDVREPGASLDGFRSFVASVNGALLLVSMIALFVGGFLIFLTFSLAVAERTRVFGTMRALGALPRQIVRVVVAEAVILGGASSLAGIALGFVISRAAIVIVGRMFGLGLQAPALPVGPVITAVVVGILTSVVAAVIPARRAARVTPVEAMRFGFREDARPARPYLGAALFGAGFLVLLRQVPPAVAGLASILLLLGAVLVVPSMLRPLARLLGRATSWRSRGVGDIAVMHLVKERSRSAYTLALVMVVLAMILAVGASNASIGRSVDEVIARQAGADLEIYAPSTLDDGATAGVRGTPGVQRVSPVRFGGTEVVDAGGASTRVGLTVIDPASYFDVTGIPWVDGSDRAARDALGRSGSVVLPAPFAEKVRVRRGGHLTLRTSEGLASFTVAGTYAVVGGGFGVIAGLPDLGRFGAGRPNALLVDVAPGTTSGAVRAAVLSTVGASRQLTIQTSDAIRAGARAQLRSFYALPYAALAIAALVGLLGLANTLIVSVLTRTREIGVLRSVGTLRRQVRRMVVVEAVTLAAVAVVLAVPLGVLLAVGIVDGQRRQLGFTLGFTFPWPAVPVLAIATLALAALASFLPGRRAAATQVTVALRAD